MDNSSTGKSGTNKNAAVSLASAIIGAVWALFLPFGLFAGLVLGVVAIVYSRKAKKENAGRMATAGLVIGVIALVTAVIALLFNLMI